MTEDILWYKDAVLYEIYVRAFCDSNGDGIGDFQGLTSKLDYVKDLGIDCIWLMPFFSSPLVDDGYDISDYFGIHPDLGTVEDVRAMLHAAHERGLRVIADLVLNHTSNQHRWFKESRASRDSELRRYYIWRPDDRGFPLARIIFIDTQTSNWERDPVSGEYYFHRFYAEQPDLNFDDSRVQQAMIDVIRFWLDLGLDGFRCDAVPYLFKREETNCENLLETHAYLKALRRFVDDSYPGRILLAEANQWPEQASEYFGRGDEMQMAFHFPLMPRVFKSLKEETRDAIAWILDKTPQIPSACQWCTFLRNHDELTLEMVTLEEREFLWNTYAPDPRMRLNLGIRRRLAPLLDNNKHKVLLANSILLTIIGSPIIYYGDEIGMGDNIWLKDRDGVRTPMQWNDQANAGFSSSDSLFEPLVDDVGFGYKAVNVERQRQEKNSLLNLLRNLIEARKKYHAFGRGTTQLVELGNEHLLGYERVTNDEHVLVINNLSSNTQRFRPIQYSGRKGWDILNAREFAFPSEGELEPFGFLWLFLEGSS